MFYLIVRRLVRDAVFLMKRERKVRVMPRHFMVASVISQIIPMSFVDEHALEGIQLDQV